MASVHLAQQKLLHCPYVRIPNIGVVGESSLLHLPSMEQCCSMVSFDYKRNLHLFGSFQKVVGCSFGFGAYQLVHYGSKLEVITVEERTCNKGKNQKNSLCSFLHFPMPQQHHSWYIRNGYPKN